MHMGYPNYEQQYQIRGPSGIIWAGTAIFGVPYLVTSTDAAAISSGVAMIIDGPNTTLGRDALVSTADPDIVVLSGVAVVSAASVGFLGVTVGPVAIGARALVAGPGSLCTVAVTSGAIAVGGHITGSASAGLCANLTPATTAGVRLGVCIKAAAQIGSQGVYTAGVLVAPN